MSLLLCLSISFADAQSLTNRERRHINSKVLTLIEEYERYVSVYDDDAAYAFQNLFSHDAVPVVCDVIGFPSYLEQVPVSEYIRQVRDVVATTDMQIKDVRKGEMKFTGNVWTIPVTFRKSVSYIDSNGYAFSIDEYYGKDMQMTMSVSYNPDSDICLIESIEGKVDSDIIFPKGRFFIVNKSVLNDVPNKYKKYIPELKVGGKGLVYNEFEQSILPSGLPVVNDVDILVAIDTLSRGANYDVVGFKFNRRKGRMKIRYGMAPFGAYKVTTSHGIGHKSGAMEAGLDFGVTWSSGAHSKMGFFGGAGVSVSHIDLSLNSPVSYSYETSVLDDQTKMFNRLTLAYDIDSASESLKFMDVFVPVYFEVEHMLGKHILLSWNFGVKAYYHLETNIEPYKMSGTVTVTDDVNSPPEVHDLTQEFTDFIMPASYQRRPFDISAMANLGLDINLYKRKFYLMLKGGYEYGITRTFTSSGKRYFNELGYIYPVVYDPRNNKVSALHSFIGNTSYHRQAIWLEAGFKFKM